MFIGNDCLCLNQVESTVILSSWKGSVDQGVNYTLIINSYFSLHICSAVNTLGDAMSEHGICNQTAGEDSLVTISVSTSTLLWLVVDGTLFVVIVSGNLVTLFVLRSSLQFTPLISSQLVMSLALSDMLVGLTLPYHMAIQLAPQLAAQRLTCVIK